MARVLLGWELGANRGHIARLAPIAHALRALGHDVAVALQRIDGAVHDLPDGAALWQAPLWPRLLSTVNRAASKPPATMGDILVHLGLDSADTLAALVRGWDSILGAVKPDLVVSDFAPALLCAVRGRVPVIAVGTGFERVPGELDRFPSLMGGDPLHDEAATLAAANAALRMAGRAPLDRLPAMFEADVPMAGEFDELDIYAEWRKDPVYAPSIALPLPPLASGSGDEVFVYGFEQMRPDAALWSGLAAAKLPVRIHVPNAPSALLEAIGALGMRFEPRPLPWGEIARRSRVVVSHGGHGFVCSALIAGLPQVVTHYDLEKRGYGQRLARAHLGGTVGMAAIRVEPFAASLRALYDNDAFAERVRAAAPSFRARCDVPFGESVMAAVGRLIG